jgi:hypothetical protein
MKFYFGEQGDFAFAPCELYKILYYGWEFTAEMA